MNAIIKYFLEECKEEDLDEIIIDFYKSKTENLITLSQLYLYFSSHFMKKFNETIKHLESNLINSSHLYDIMINLRTILENRKNTNNFGQNVKKYIVKFSNAEKEKFYKNARQAYSRAITYLDDWFDFSPNSLYSKMQNLNLEKDLNFDDLSFISEKLNILVNKDDLQDECIIFNRKYKSKLDDCKKDLPHDKKWAYLLLELNVPNLHLIVESILVIPIGNHYVERGFSVMNYIMRDDRGSLLIESVRTLLCIKLNYNMPCKDFCDYVKTQDKMLKLVKSQQKYDHINKGKQ
jgi:hypothetical protein